MQDIALIGTAGSVSAAASDELCHLLSVLSVITLQIWLLLKTISILEGTQIMCIKADLREPPQS